MSKSKKEYVIEKKYADGVDTGNTKLVVEKYKVGDSSKTGYEGRFIFNIFHSDSLIRRTLQKGYYLDQEIVIALWNCAIPGGTFIDVGSNIGTVVIPMSRRAKKCYSFEIQKPIYNLLKKNIKKNKCQNIKAYNCGLGHYNGMASLDSRILDHLGNVRNLEYTGSQRINYGSVRLGIGGPETELKTLDGMKLKKITSIKVDVEGAEPLVFYGARKTIKKYLPVIAFEKNFQHLESDAMQQLKLTDRILEFDIVRYAESLGYQSILEIKIHNFLLLHGPIPRTSDPLFKVISTNTFIDNLFPDTKLKKFRMIKPKW